jgi:hypothetical protein
MAETIAKPEPWNCSHAKEIIPFGITTPSDGVPCEYTTIQNVDGKAAFETDASANGYDYPPPSRFFYTPSGPHAGVIHVISRITEDGFIYTETDFISNDSASDATVLPNLTYRLWYGVPDPTAGTAIDIKPLWKSDGTLVVNLAEYLKSIFPAPIPPPVEGDDTNMYSWFMVEIIPSQDFDDWAVSQSLDAQDMIDDFTEYIWDDTDVDEEYENLWRVIRGTFDHEEFNALFTGATDVLNEYTPVLQPEGTIISKIFNNRLYNYFL